MIFIGYRGVGKSTLCRKNCGFVDLEQSAFFSHCNCEATDFWKLYCDFALGLAEQGYGVFAANSKGMVNALKGRHLREKICVIIPSGEYLVKLCRERPFLADTYKRVYQEIVDTYNELKESNIGDLVDKIEIEDDGYDLGKVLEDYIDIQKGICAVWRVKKKIDK